MTTQKKLYRNTDDVMLAGVISGLADYFGFDTTIARLFAFTGVVLTGVMPGVLLYIGAWLIVPEKPTIQPIDKTDYTVYN